MPSSHPAGEDPGRYGIERAGDGTDGAPFQGSWVSQSRLYNLIHDGHDSTNFVPQGVLSYDTIARRV